MLNPDELSERYLTALRSADAAAMLRLFTEDALSSFQPELAGRGACVSGVGGARAGGSGWA